MKVGTIVKTSRMKDWGIIRAVDKNKTLVECNDTNDGKMYFCVSVGIHSVDYKRRLIWVRTKDLISYK